MAQHLLKGSSIARWLVPVVFAVPLVVGVIQPTSDWSAFRTAHAEEETRRTPALRERYYTKLAEAQEAIDARDFATALEVLQDMLETRGINAYESASGENMMAFIHFSQENYPAAIRAYEAILRHGEEIPLALEQSTLYALGQLNFVQEDYNRAIDYLDRWFAIAPNPGPQPFIFKAQALYQLQRFREIPAIVEEAMQIAISRDQEVKENWWLLIRAAYYELEDWDNVINILEILVRDFPKKDYWIQLSGIYGQEGRGPQQVAAIWAAYIQGYLEEEREYLNVAGLLLQEEVPYWASVVLEEGFEAEIIERDSRNLQMLAQAYQLAQEVDAAIPVYQEAAGLSDEGELYFRLAQLYLDKDECGDAIDAADSALEKGGLRNRAQVLLVKGMCEFEEERFDQALRSLRESRRVAESETDESAAAQWVQYVTRERDRAQALAESQAAL